MTQEVIRHQEYSLSDVFKTIQPYLKEGISFDFDTNEGYPVQIGTVYSFHVLKDTAKVNEGKTVELDDGVPEDSTPEETQALLEASESFGTNVSATSELPVVKLQKTRRALSKQETS